jgi:glycosyltransferase involved in cell wall biosynthesis
MSITKNIWLVNKYAMPPQYESRLRTIKFAHYLQEMGYKVTIFGSSVMHNMDLDLIKDKSKYKIRQYGDLHFVHIKSCRYQKTAGLSRIWSEIQFHYRLTNLAKKFEKPDLVVATTFPLFSNPIMSYCHKCGIKYITEILDWWPDDFVDFGLVSAKNPIMKFLFWRAKKNYVESDATVFSTEGYIEYIKDKKWDKEHGGPVVLSKMHYINNGVDLHDFNTWVNQYTINDEDLNSDKKRIIYLGSVRLANDVGQFVKAAELLKDKEDLLFLIYGNGDDREPLIQYCQEHGLRNVKFKDKWIDPQYVPYVLSQSYLNILNYTKGFGKYGISSSKMFQYMAAGKPIVCNVNIMYSAIDKYQIGVCHDMKNDEDYAAALRSIIDLPETDYNAMCKRASEAVKEFDYPYLAKQMSEVIESL